MQARFIISAARPDQFPKGNGRVLPEIAFLGRSNVGKSSLLNALVGEPTLAFTSSRPGCTQLINFYRIGDSFLFADLPGYGYARVPPEKKAEWKRLIESYLLNREPLSLCVLLLDARRGWMDSDLELTDWLKVHGRRYIIAATKIDKLKTQREKRESLEALREHYPDGEVAMVSAETGHGVKELWQAIARNQK
jgi:GTP-binding protein